jgi:hypothetical protein
VRIACDRASVDFRIHDLRRSAARNKERASVVAPDSSVDRAREPDPLWFRGVRAFNIGKHFRNVQRASMQKTPRRGKSGEASS